MPRSTRRLGMTLIEVVIVLNIVAIIAAVIVPTYRAAQRRAEEASCISNLKELWREARRFKQDHREYPDSLTELYQAGYVNSTEDMVCPADPRMSQVPDNNPRFGESLLYVKRPPNAKPDDVLMACPYHTRGLVLREDGSIQRVDFQSAKLTGAMNVEVMNRESTGWQPTNAGIELEAGDTIRTNAGGSATILFEEGSTIALAANSELTLKQASPAERPGRLVRVVSLYAGKLVAEAVDNPAWFVGGGGRFEVQTSAATAAVRGTIFTVSVDNSDNTTETIVSVQRGKVEVTANGRGSAKRVITPPSGELHVRKARTSSNISIHQTGGTGGGGGSDGDDHGDDETGNGNGNSGNGNGNGGGNGTGNEGGGQGPGNDDGEGNDHDD